MDDPNAALETVKEDVVTHIRAQVLGFLNEALPKIKIPPVEQKDPPLKFSVTDLQIESGENLTIKEEDIAVEFGDLLEVEKDDVLTVTVSNIGARIKDLKWCYELESFPYMFGDGLGSVQMAGANITISFKVNAQRPVPPRASALLTCPTPPPARHLPAPRSHACRRTRSSPAWRARSAWAATTRASRHWSSPAARWRSRPWT
jgi:hypothetical protein